MAILFASGGGRIGNQFINLFHLTALSIEYETKIYKINDNYFLNKNYFPYFLFRVDSVKNRWKLNDNKDSYIIKRFKNIIFRIFVRILHFALNIFPNTNSYKYGDKKSRVDFLAARNLSLDEIQSVFMKSDQRFSIISGWGIRNWDLVYKHFYKIKNIFEDSLSNNINCELVKKIESDFLFVHIRHGDFDKFDFFRDNFVHNKNIWEEAIVSVCLKEKIKNIVLFTDDYPVKELLSNLSYKGLNTYIPEDEIDNNFNNLFITYASKSKSILCNCSTFCLSISFIYHKYVYTPDPKKEFIKTKIFDLYKTKPFCKNWK